MGIGFGWWYGAGFMCDYVCWLKRKIGSLAEKPQLGIFGWGGHSTLPA